MSEKRKEYDRKRSAKRYERQRQNSDWMKQQAAKKRAKYKRRPKVSRDNSKRRNKALVASLKLSAGKCHDCGLTISPDILYLFDFDHREPRLKKFALSQVRTESVESILDEAEKCDVVCKNCHAHRTHRQRKDEHVAILREIRQTQQTIRRDQPRLFDET
jgi:hypothetical protein